MKALLIAGAVLVGFTAAADAQSRQYVKAGTTGTTCTYVAPCPYAFDPAFGPLGGVIKLLSDGDFGPIFASQPVSIEGSGAGSSLESVSWTGDPKHVFLRNLSVASYTGMQFQTAGSLTISDVSVAPYFGGAPLTPSYNASGLHFRPAGTASLTMKNVAFANVPTGGREAIRITSAGQSLNVSLDNVHVSGGNAGIIIDATGGGFVRVSITNSTFTNIAGNAITATAGSGKIRLYVDGVTMTTNGNGIVANGTNFIGWMGETTIAGNNIGVQRIGGANLMSFKNNYIYNNSTDGIPLPNTWAPPADAAPVPGPAPAGSAFLSSGR